MIDELEGDPRWWGGRIPDNLVLNELHPEQMSKWKRKRLEPLLSKLLFPVCWSLLLLVIGILFSLLNYKTNFPQSLGLIILIFGPFSLAISIIYISNKHENSKPIKVLSSLFGRSRILWISIILFILITSIIQKPTNNIFWNLAILPSIILWIEWLAFGSYYFSSPSAIWIMKYNSENDLPMEKLVENGWRWQSDNLKPRNEPFATKTLEGNILELSSSTLGEENILVLSWWQKGGIRSDPFVAKKMKALAIPGLTNKLGYSTSDFDLEMLDGIRFLDEYCVN
tara:strand:- start:636 stop:1484 length:849 start_codon:yes stop_codon:yes gene_type:complete